MRSISNKLSRLLSTLLLVISCTYAHATTDPTWTSRFRGQVDSIHVDSSRTTIDINYYAMGSAIEKTYGIQNVVSVGIDESSPYYIQSDFDVTIKLELTVTRADGTDTIFDKDFRINYKMADSSKNATRMYYSFANGYKVKMKIKTITPAAAINWDYKKVLLIENSLTATRDYVFGCTDDMPLPVITVPDPTPVPDELKVHWDNSAAGQTVYDLEWAWIDESAVADYYMTGSSTAFDQHKLFNNNASRVTVDFPEYAIPLFYDGDGRLFIRVRRVQMKETGQRIEGEWSATAATEAVDMYIFTGHDTTLNWQASTSYAEQGKRKTVIQYFDGTLRSRQTVTKDNSTATSTTSGTTVVAETFYDYQGRAVIQVLPAPTLNTIISYSRSFNQFVGTPGYDKSFYDKLSDGGSICGDPAPGLSTADGASRYYSPSNDLQDGFNKFIPDAQGYPYTETRYKADGTGIASQGGVGANHRLGSGHETKYSDEVPAQSELDALFGTDAGISSHYTKDWVKDANGQYSISYADMQGHTVATALAGTAPLGMDSLRSGNTKTVIKSLLDPVTNIINGRSIISNSSLFLDKDGYVFFHYAVTPDQLRLLDCNQNTICYDCLYDLIITVTPECNNNAVPGSPYTHSNFTLGEYADNHTCAANSPLFNDTFTLRLNEGAYIVTKELRLSAAGQDYLRDSIFLPANTCKTLETFTNHIDSVLVSQANCNITCEACTLALGTDFNDFVDKLRIKMGLLNDQDTIGMTASFQSAYNEAKAGCDRICNKDIDDGMGNVRNMRKIMLMDMTAPGGQYARIEAPYVTMPYNIFSTSAAPSGTYFTGDPETPIYLNPLNLNSGADPLVTTNYLPDHLYNDGSGNPQLDVSPPASPVSIPAQAFSDQFHDSWAISLLPYHPEYHKLILSETSLAPANHFEGMVNNIDTWSGAVSHNLITNMLGEDSFFMPDAPGAYLYADMHTKMETLFASSACGTFALTMWQVAEAAVFCRDYPEDNACGGPQLYCAIAEPTHPSNTQAGSCADWDYVWKGFKTSYFGERKKLIDRYLADQCPEIHNDQIASYNTSTNTVYTIRFPQIADVAGSGDLGALMDDINNGDYSAGITASQDATLAQFDSTCKGYSAIWYNRLMTCQAVRAQMNATDSAWIINNLRAICKAGSDADHILGSSSLPASAPPIHDPSPDPWGGDYSDFPSVITRYLENSGIDISAFCHPYLIEAPKPYDLQSSLANMPVVTKPTDCQCDLLHRYKAEYLTSSSASFSEYLENQYATYISQGALDTLGRLCDGTYSCVFLPVAIKLPPLLQCHGATDPPPQPCINCQRYSEIKSQYIGFFNPAMDVPIPVPADTNELAINHSFELYANYQTGFQLHWSEYLDFQNACANQPGIPCDSLQYVLNLFYQSPQYMENPTGSSCRSLFTAFFNDYFDSFYSFDQLMNLFLQKCGTIPTVCSAQITCSEFTSLINDFYTDNGVAVFNNENCSAIFTTYFNLRKHTNYTYHQLDSLYSLCGCTLDVCDFPNCFLLTRVYNAFRSVNGSTLWNNPNCQGMFEDYFNSYFQFGPGTYKWPQIADMYEVCLDRGCGPDIKTLCQPPYSCETINTIVQLFYTHYGDGITAMEHCKDSFALFFNQQMHTSYSYAQIAALYAITCKMTLQVCDPIYNCQELVWLITNFKQHVVYTADSCEEKFTAYFNLYYGTTYEFDEIIALYKRYCGETPKICDDPITLGDCRQLEVFLEDFMGKHPDPAEEFGDSCQAAFTNLFNTEFGTDLTYTEIVNYYEVLCYRYLDICQSQCDKYNNLIAKMPQALCHDFKLPPIAANQLFVYLFNQQLKAAGQPEMEYAQVITITKDCPGTGDCWQMIADSATRGLSEPDVLQSLKLAYYLMHPEGMPEDCQEDFASWVNLCTGDSLDYKALQERYETLLGPGAGYICSLPPEDLNIVLDSSAMRYSLSSGGPLLCGLNEPVYPDVALVTDPCGDLINTALGFADEQYEYYLDSLRNVFDTSYMNKCLSVKDLETFTATYSSSEYHYTLYYYDQAGNLVKTIPPEGVHADFSDTWLNTTVPAARNSGAVAVPPHTLATQYRYNTLNQVIAQNTPDAGTSHFWYDRLGRLVISQNAKQQTTNKYSYTLYDLLGRITEVGEKPKLSSNPPMDQSVSQDEYGPAGLEAWLNTSDPDEMKEQLTRTVYDDPWDPFCDDADPSHNVLCQKNLRNRVSYSYVKNTDDDSDPDYLWDAATFYSYDIHGNVDTLLQDYKTGMGAIACESTPSGNRWKKLVYKYDLISGKVNEVAYQPGMSDQFYHQYEYDAENRIINVKTSRDRIYWENDASYTYYRHGPLARTVLGQTQVQGLDYAYTLQGWLKGVNSTTVGDGTYDMGNDGKTGSVNSLVARDAYGFSLNYFEGDYLQINTTTTAFGVVNSNLPDPPDNVHAGSDLFNGNIRAMAVNIPKLGNAQLYGYRYDQLNRIVAMNTYSAVSTSGNTLIDPSSASQDYNERISYDANGNILGYLRNGAAAVHGLAMDSLSYKYNYYTAAGELKTYTPGGVVPSDAARLTNQLNYVKDAAGGTYTEDIKDEDADNYTYDEIGNLTSDVKENIDVIEWTVYGKINHIHKTDGTDINYTYDASGNRITKTVRSETEAFGIVSKTTYYVRDASGNVMSVYRSGTGSPRGDDLTQTELHLYGSSRLGIYNVNNNVQCPADPDEITTFIRGDKFFELSSQTGNILATVSDKKIAHDNGYGTIDYYGADVITAGDMYSGGMIMPGRKYQQGTNSYRYGFNGKEDDNEVKGEGNELDYGMRIYDPRLGRFLSVDPLTSKYAMLTPYQFASNNPIHNIDLDGLEGVGFEANLDRWITQLSNNKITPKQFEDRKRAAAMGGLVGVGLGLVIIDNVYNGGRVSQFLLTSQILGHLYHNRSPDPAENERRKNELTNDLIGLSTGYVLGKAINLTTRILTSTGKAIYKTFSSASVRFSQSSVNDLDEVLVSMQKNGWKGDPIDIVKMKDGAYTTADNTRLLAAKKAGINIQADSHNYDDVIPEDRAKTMLNKKGEAPTTWGEAIENRIQKQNAQFRKDYTESNGTYNEPKVGETKKTAASGN